MTKSSINDSIEPDDDSPDRSPSVEGAAPQIPGMTRNQRVTYAIIGITLGLVVGIWMALMLNGIQATDEPGGNSEDLQRDLEELQEELDALTMTLDEARGQMSDNEEVLASTLQLVDDVQGQMDELIWDVDGLQFRLWEQNGDLEVLRAQIDGTRTELDATRVQLFEALLQLEYAKGRQDGTVPVNLTMDDLADVLEQLANAISQMEATQAALSEAMAQLLKALGNGPPEGMALYSPHLAHYESPLINFECAMCHNANPEGDLAAYDGKLYFNGSLSSVDFRVQIDERRECSICHDWFPEDEMEPGDKDRSCFHARCHDDWREEMDSLYVNEDIVEVDDCLLCHGGQPFYPR